MDQNNPKVDDNSTQNRIGDCTDDLPKPKTYSRQHVQITEWYTDDIWDNPDHVSVDSGSETQPGRHFQIHLFGKTSDGKSCGIVVRGFPCYFYLLIPKRWRLHDWDQFVKQLAKKMSRRDPSLRILTDECDIVTGHKFRGFTNNKLYNFGRLRFPDSVSMKRTAGLFIKREIDGDVVVKTPIKNLGHPIMAYRDEVELYESNVDPLLRFIHIKNLEPCGWVSVPKHTRVSPTEHVTTCQVEYQIDNWYNDLEHISALDNVPLVTASFDIECTSSHGDFPQARKRFTKLAKDLLGNESDYQMKTVTLSKQKLTDILNTVITKDKGEIKRIYLKNPKTTKEITKRFPELSLGILTDLWIYHLALESSKVRQRVPVLATDLSQYLPENNDKNLLFHLNYLGSFIPGLRFHPRNLNIYENPNSEKVEPIPFELDYGIQGRITRIEIQQVRGKGVKPTLMYLTTDNSYSLKKGDIVIFSRESTSHQPITKTKVLNIDSEARKITVSLDIKQAGITENSTLESDTLWWSLGKITKKDPYPFVEEQITRRIDCTFTGERFEPIPSDDNTSYGDSSEDVTDDNYALEGDPVIQIGTCFQKQGDPESYRRVIYTLDTCDKFDPEVEVVEFAPTLEGERAMLLAWQKLLCQEDPDIITGYNIFAFDFPYLFERAKELGILDKFSEISRIRDLQCRVTERRGKLNSKFVEIPGRVEVDLFKVIQRDHNLDSYKLDGVSSTFIRGAVKNVTVDESDISEIQTDNTIGLKPGNFVQFILVKGYDEDRLQEGKKFEIVRTTSKTITVTGKVTIPNGYKASWCLGKDDVSAQDIFRFQGMGSRERAIVAKYCVMDVILCLELMNKLQILTNNIGMSNVCSTPLSWIFTRGQGIKILSLVAKRCRVKRYYLPYLYPDPFEESYEGAIVLKPYPGIYLDDAPVSVLDYASLYPNSMRSENLSHETLITDKEWLHNKSERLAEYGYRFSSVTYDNFRKIKDTKIKTGTQTDRFVQPERTGSIVHLENRATMKGVKYTAIVTTTKIDGLVRGDEIKISVRDGDNTCLVSGTIWKISTKKDQIIKIKGHHADSSIIKWCNQGKLIWSTYCVGIIPLILTELLTARKTTRKRINNQKITVHSGKTYTGLVGKTTDTTIQVKLDGTNKTIEISLDDITERSDQFSSFQKDVLDGLQLAYKITANSLYGQIGAVTSAINWKNIAASTTATGRAQLYIAKDYIENHYPGSKVVYGDTDSIFVKFHMPNPKQPDEILRGRDALKESIRLGVESSERIKTKLKEPQDLEYEKTFMPFILLSKKRYVGNKYEFDPDKYKQTSMGIVLKRRDNAPILKVIYGGIIDIIMGEMNINRSVDFLRRSMRDLVKGRYGLEKLIISKTLNGHYKNPEMIAHKVLADRMAERDPGNKPQVNDRIPYVYIQTKGDVALQGDRIEHPDYIREKRLKPDYHLYVTNQIMKPVSQIFALCLDDITGLQNMLLRRHGPGYFSKMERQYQERGYDQDKIDKGIRALKQRVAEEYLFYDIQREMENQRKMRQEITKWFPSS